MFSDLLEKAIGFTLQVIGALALVVFWVLLGFAFYGFVKANI